VRAIQPLVVSTSPYSPATVETTRCTSFAAISSNAWLADASAKKLIV